MALYGSNIYTIESYETEANFREDVNEQDFSTDGQFTSTMGRIVKYHSTTLMYMEVRIPNLPGVVEIHSGRPLTLIEMANFADALRPLN